MPQGITPTWNDYARDASDIDDPIVRGMRQSAVGLWVPGLGATGTLLPDVTRTSGPATVASPTWAEGPFGQSVRGVITTQYLLTTLTDFSFVFVGRFDNFLYDSILRYLTDGGNFYFNDYTSDSTPNFYLRTASPYEADIIKFDATMDTDWHVLGIRVVNKVMSGWKDGVKQAAEATHNNAVPLSTPLVIGDIYAHYTSLGAWWERGIPDEAMRKLGQDPLCLVRKTRRWLPVAVAAPTTNRRRRLLICGAA